MICPDCNHRFEGDEDSCPRCGGMKGVVKTSTILISAGGTRKVYRSVDEVPGPLRKRLLRSTHGLNSATIVIADRQGRKEIAKAIRSLPRAIRGEAQAVSPSSGPSGGRLSLVFLRSAAVILLLAATAIIWTLFR